MAITGQPGDAFCGLDGADADVSMELAQNTAACNTGAAAATIDCKSVIADALTALGCSDECAAELAFTDARSVACAAAATSLDVCLTDAVPCESGETAASQAGGAGSGTSTEASGGAALMASSTAGALLAAACLAM